MKKSCHPFLNVFRMVFFIGFVLFAGGAFNLLFFTLARILFPPSGYLSDVETLLIFVLFVPMTVISIVLWGIWYSINKAIQNEGVSENKIKKVRPNKYEDEEEEKD